MCGEWIVKDRFTGATEWNGFKLPDRSNRYRNKAGQICFRAKKSSSSSPKRTPKKISKKPKTSVRKSATTGKRKTK